jgi:acyl-CoA hydrolase
MIPLLVLPIAKQGIRHPIISSMTLVSWNPSSSSILVTDGNFTYVSIDDQGQPQVIKREEPPISA